MTMTDPTSDLLTRIRNGLAVNKRWVDIPSSNMKKRIVYILKEEKYIDDFIYVTEFMLNAQKYLKSWMVLEYLSYRLQKESFQIR